MTNISEHDTKHEGEKYTSEQTWVDLLVSGNTVSVNNFLECPSEIINFEVCWCEDIVRGIQFNDLSGGNILPSPT